ncbi:RNA-directed DNA polymerase, eukaryota, Reverse transcriptase zinc-binding domain protein [Artemisia annua]|uniref:RNA-directed DNA polymerase, eukaryota, Reverse transcriptase zinc-binding domain protein n=1 Tax=Artemisia annua TaxID=35608 RepID=A0A2U1LSJ8_ARTAN|nr:RNA-directed DNA polymerase, eukaryota, Reverse transcriptase zinc-binding domain protein [Artemisia annua]
MSNFNGKRIWGNNNFGMDFLGSVGQSGGLLCLWDKGAFSHSSTIKNRNFLLVSGMLKGLNEVINVLNVYAPQGVVAKRVLWEHIGALVASSSGMWVILGDFNAVRFPEDRLGSVFKNSCARNFNAFIHCSGLMEFSMKGRRFTCSRDNGKKLSKIDRFLVCSSFFNKWPEACLRALPSLHSDHCPLLLTTVSKNFGLRPFRIFNSWLSKLGFEEVVCEAASMVNSGDPPDVFLSKKFRRIRESIKKWNKEMLDKENVDEEAARVEIENLETEMEVRSLSEEEEWIYVESKKVLKESVINKQLDMKQRSRVRWALDGDENSSFFHGIVNCRKACNNIPGLMVQGSWVSKPSLVKKEVFSFFKNHFVEELCDRPILECWNIKRVSNIALLSKWGWRFKSEGDSLWCEVVKAFHITNRSWDFLPVRKALSGAWSNIVKTLSRTVIAGLPIRRFFRGNVGSGSDIAFWIDPWLLNVPLMTVCPRLFSLEMFRRCIVGDRLIKSDLGIVRNWNWKRPISAEEEMAECEVLSRLLDGFVMTDSKDKWKWVGASDGVFSVGAVRRLMSIDRDFSNIHVFDWCKWIPIKCNIFGWRAEMGKIPTALALRHRNIPIIDVSCPFCDDVEETVDHLFTGCLVANALWQHVASWCKVPNWFAFSFKDLMEIHEFVGLSGRAKVIFHGITLLGCWCIWRARNRIKFQKKKERVENIIGEVKVLGFLWAKNRAKMSSFSWNDWCNFVNM